MRCRRIFGHWHNPRSHANPSLSYLAEYPVALEIGPSLGIWLTQRASTLGAMRPI